MKELVLSRGKTATVDDDDYEELSRWKWSYGTNGYAFRNIKRDNGKWIPDYLHRILTNAPKGMCVDHINGNKLDNRKENLRICNKKGNARNAKIKGNKNGLKGVHYHSKSGKYRAEITVNYKRIYLGYFDTPEEAAIAYNEAARKFHKEFASLNEV